MAKMDAKFPEKKKFSRHVLKSSEGIQIWSLHVIKKLTCRARRACRNHCFNSLNMLICDVLVVVTVVIA